MPHPLITSSSGADYSYPTVAALAAQLGHDDAGPLIDRAAQASANLAAVLALAAAEAGCPIDLARLEQSIPDLVPFELLAPLVAACQGDRTTTLLRLIEAGQMSLEMEALAVLLALELAGDEPPPRLLHATRYTCAIVDPDSDAAGLLSVAAARLDDEELRREAKRLLPLEPEYRDWATELIAPLRQPWTRTLPPGRVQASGGTLRREAPKAGRNDPCPCGSGKKYKKCHELQPAADAPEPGAMLEKATARLRELAAASADLDRSDILALRAAELAALDFERVAVAHLRDVAAALAGWSRLSDAARALDAWVRRDPESAGLLASYRLDLLWRALQAGDAGLAEEQRRHLGTLELGPPERAALALIDSPALRMALDAAARDGLDDSGTLHVALARALLRHAPALGVIVARGVVTPDRPEDSGALLDDVERLRTHAGLPTHDRACWFYEMLADEQRGARRDARAAREHAVAEEEVLRLRQRAADAAAEVRRMEDELSRRRREVKRVKTAAAAEPVATPSAQEEELRRLRTRVEELKGVIEEGKQERAALRRQLEESAARPAAAPVRPPAAPEPDDGLETEAGPTDAERGVLIPMFERRASEALKALPAHVARNALDTVAALAAGGGEAWQGVKKLQRVDKVFSARVGIHYRLLFAFAPEQLRLLNIVSREELLGAIERMR